MCEYSYNDSLKQDNNGDFSWLALRFEAILTPRLKVWLTNTSNRLASIQPLKDLLTNATQ